MNAKYVRLTPPKIKENHHPMAWRRKYGLSSRERAAAREQKSSTLISSKRKTYGSTLWGSAWLHALTVIDSGRLQRGKTYANGNRVQYVRIENSGRVDAKVFGSYGYYYDVGIQMYTFTDDEVKKLKSIIADSPVIGIQLSMGILPGELLSSMEKAKLKLLPTVWRDLHASCDCMDMADTCKHISALCFILANEIDQDPFVLFAMRGVKRADLVGDITVKPENMDRHVNPILHKTAPNSELIVTNLEEILNDPEYVPPSFSFTPINPHSFVALLQDNPPFYNQGNFRDLILNLYGVVSDYIPELFTDNPAENLLWNTKFQLQLQPKRTSRHYRYEVKIAPPLTELELADEEVMQKFQRTMFKATQNISCKISIKMNNGKFTEWNGKKFTWKQNKVFRVTDINPILDYFINASVIWDTADASPQYIFLSALGSIAVGMVRANLFLPECYRNGDCFFIRYSPYLNNVEVKACIESLQQIMPVDICDTAGRFLTAEGVVDLLSLFISRIVHRSLEEEKIPKLDLLQQIFTSDTPHLNQSPSENRTYVSILNWLEPLSLQKEEVVPQIRIELQDESEDFLIHVDVVSRSDNMLTPINLKDLFQPASTRISEAHQLIFDRPLEVVQHDISRQLVVAGQHMHELLTIVNSQGKHAPAVSLERMAEILMEAAEIFDAMGILLVLPKELKKLAFPTLYAKASFKGETGTSYFKMNDLLSFSYEIAIGDQKISAPAFKKLVKGANGMVKVNDQYLILRPDEVQEILERINKPLSTMTSAMEAMYTLITGTVDGLDFVPDKALQNVMADLMKINEYTIPANLNATLRPYQERGYQWLCSNAEKGFGSCIADDMGLGKTIQVIAMLLHFKNEGKSEHPSLVICPTTLIGNWEKECTRFAPSLNLHIYHGAVRKLHLENVDLLITSYGTFRRDFEMFNEKPWKFLIIDEAQNIKNVDTAQSRAIKSLKASHYVSITGTPVENKLTELWNLFDFTNRGYLGTVTQFKTRLATPIEKEHDQEAVVLLKKATSPFLLRRLKTDRSIITDLPDKVTFDEYCYLTTEQAAIYQGVVDNTMKLIEQSEGIQRRGLILKLITQLKQVCNHPAHFNSAGSCHSLLSGKAAKTVDTLQTIFENREKAIIFTQYKEMGDLLQQMIQEELSEPALFFHGSLTRQKRDSMVELFQNDRKSKVMIISLKAGGSGLNLTAATNVIHYDLWWNPAVENQATDRAYRIGQQNKVFVHRLITLGTFEEKIDEMIKAKKALADLTVATGEQWITEVSNNDLREIFTLFRK